METGNKQQSGGGKLYPAQPSSTIYTRETKFHKARLAPGGG